MSFEEVVDGVGVAVIVVGAAVASAGCVVRWRRAGDFASVYGRYRQDLGRAVLLGLELLGAGDIIRTVAVAPTFGGLGALACFPWQQPSPPPDPSGGGHSSGEASQTEGG